MSEEEKVQAEGAAEQSVPQEPEKYIGQSKVVKMETRDNGFVHYELEDGQTGLVKPDQYANMVRGAAYNDQLVQVYKWNPVTAKILMIALEYDVPMGEADFIARQFQQSIVDSYEKSVSKLFKRQLTDHIRLTQIDQVLKTDTELLKE